MIKKFIPIVLFTTIAIISFSFRDNNSVAYRNAYDQRMQDFKTSLQEIFSSIDKSDLNAPGDIESIKQKIQASRYKLKAIDFWLRYLEPTVYMKLNGPIPVEWETEVFEKFEKPYKREGAGLTLAALYLKENNINRDSLRSLVQQALTATNTYTADSITGSLNSYHHFFLCNRLFLLNLAAIYTTGFECPDTVSIVPELRNMMAEVYKIYGAYNESFPATALPGKYMLLYKSAMEFVNTQPNSYTQFDHFTFIKNYINPLFSQNQDFIHDYHVVSHSLIDYALNKNGNSIFKKTVYNGQNPKGIFLRVDDENTLAEIDRLGKLLFYDPVLSGNNERSCVSCHNPTQYFTDTIRSTSIQYDHKSFLPRNSPSLLNVQFNHLVMLDGKLISLQDQAKAVITNPIELGCEEKEMMKKILSCKEYRTSFKKLLKYTPQEKEITFEHIASAITYYYAKSSRYYAPFDDAMNDSKPLSTDAQKGFNLFMSKAQCGTCHFVPQFNGVKPPFVSSEFEVLGVPEDTAYKKISSDKGRYGVHQAPEMMHAFRTGTLRNTAYTKPYMHNGVFTTLNEVIDFYDAGGAKGRGLQIENQTLAADSLKLSTAEKRYLIAFINSLNENIEFEKPPAELPVSKIRALNVRKVGGVY